MWHCDTWLGTMRSWWLWYWLNRNIVCKQSSSVFIKQKETVLRFGHIYFQWVTSIFAEVNWEIQSALWMKKIEKNIVISEREREIVLTSDRKNIWESHFEQFVVSDILEEINYYSVCWNFTTIQYAISCTKIYQVFDKK